MYRKEQGAYCVPTEARHGLECGLKTDLLQAKVAVPEETTPEEHPVQTGTMVHNDHTSLSRNEAITGYHHLHPKYQLQQRLQVGKDSQDRRRIKEKGEEKKTKIDKTKI